MHRCRLLLRAGVALLALGLVLSPLTVAAREGLVSPGFTVDARGAAIVDLQTGEFLFAQDPERVIPPASLAKIMTLFLAFEAMEAGRLQRDTPIAVSERAWAQNFPGSSLMFLAPGDQVTAWQVMQGIAIASGNDACVALAEHLAGSEQAFVAMMNEKARELGLSQTRFADAHGLSADARVTAREMALLVRAYLQRFPAALELHSQREFEYVGIEQFNRNRLLWSYPEADGLKTGYIPESGYNLVATAQRDGMRLISVLLGTAGEEEREQMAGALLTFGFENFTHLDVVQPGRVMARADVLKGMTDRVALVPRGSATLLIARGDADSLSWRTEAPQRLIAPVSRGDVLGYTVLTYHGRELARFELVADEDIAPAGWWKRTQHSLRLFWEQVSAGRSWLPFSAR